MSFSHAASCLAVNLSGILFNSQKAGLIHFGSVDVKPLSPLVIHTIHETVCSTATETVLMATKKACEQMRAAGIDNGELVATDKLIAAWKWLLDHGIGAMLPSADGPKGVLKWRAPIEQERAAWFQTKTPKADIGKTTKTSVLRDKKAEARDAWLYKQAKKGDKTYRQIALELGRLAPAKGWRKLSSPQAVEQAVDRYIKRHKLDPLPPRTGR